MAAEEEILKSPMDIKGLMRNALIRLAKQNSVEPTQVGVKLYFEPKHNDGNGAMGYWLYINGAPTRAMFFLADVVGKTSDLSDREMLLNLLCLQGIPQLGIAQPAIHKFAKEFKLEGNDWQNLCIMVRAANNENANPVLLLYNGDPVKEENFLRQLFIEKDFF